jgi:hypothetical protein
VKQRVEKQVVLNRVTSFQQDLNRLQSHLRLWEWLYRTEWSAITNTGSVEVSGEELFREIMATVKPAIDSKRVQTSLVNKGGWLVVDREVLSIGLMGLVTHAIQTTAHGDSIDLMVEKLPPTTELPEGWMSFTIAGHWKDDEEPWPTGTMTQVVDSLFTSRGAESKADGKIGIVVAIRVAQLLKGHCRRSETRDGRRYLQLLIPTRLPTIAFVETNVDEGPAEELVQGWKLGNAV